MISVELAWGLVGVAAGASWRWSRPIAVALTFVFLARLAYLQTHLEAMRWVAIVPSAAGVYELVTRAKRRLACARSAEKAVAWEQTSGTFGAKVWREMMEDGVRRARFSRVDVIALACVASSASDGAAAITHRIGLPWSLQYVQSVILLGMTFVCVWPGKEAPS